MALDVSKQRKIRYGLVALLAMVVGTLFSCLMIYLFTLDYETTSNIAACTFGMIFAGTMAVCGFIAFCGNIIEAGIVRYQLLGITILYATLVYSFVFGPPECFQQTGILVVILSSSAMVSLTFCCTR